MSKLPSRAEACALLGCADRELVTIDDSPAGVIYRMADGTALIDVVQPDAAGKTGLMFAHAPALDGGREYSGSFPVFAPFPDDAPARKRRAKPSDDGTVDDLSKLTPAKLVAHGAAQDPPVVLDPSLSKADMLVVLADAAAAKEAADDENGDQGGDGTAAGAGIPADEGHAAGGGNDGADAGGPGAAGGAPL
ncbi:MAG: hypothetical protein Q7V57_11235 [Actinomycetota bacterium]|nr:hypothetical protein [Actinomycetota bacterium]